MDQCRCNWGQPPCRLKGELNRISPTIRVRERSADGPIRARAGNGDAAQDIANADRDARAIVQQPLTSYLRTFISQGERLQPDTAGIDGNKITSNDMDTLAAFAFERFFNSGSLIGSPEKCERLIDRLIAVGVDEIACLIDWNGLRTVRMD